MALVDSLSCLRVKYGQNIHNQRHEGEDRRGVDLEKDGIRDLIMQDG